MRKTYKIYYDTILNSIDNEGYNKKSLQTDKEKLTFLYEIYQKEYAWYEKQYNCSLSTALKEWLQGLPTACSLPYTYYDIEQLIRQVEPDATDKRIEQLTERYWDFMAMRLQEMLKRNEII
jgi:hypothetical protein